MRVLAFYEQLSHSRVFCEQLPGAESNPVPMNWCGRRLFRRIPLPLRHGGELTCFARFRVVDIRISHARSSSSLPRVGPHVPSRCGSRPPQGVHLPQRGVRCAAGAEASSARSRARVYARPRRDRMAGPGKGSQSCRVARGSPVASTIASTWPRRERGDRSRSPATFQKVDDYRVRTR